MLSFFEKLFASKPAPTASLAAVKQEPKAVPQSIESHIEPSLIINKDRDGQTALRSVKSVIVLMVVVLTFTLRVQALDGVVGSVDFSGNPAFDADSIANSDANPWQWSSYPGARLVLNPSPHDTAIPPPLGSDLPLNLGGWVGARTYLLYSVNRVRMLQAGTSDVDAVSVKSTWYPYKYSYDATYPNGAHLDGDDFFINSDSSLIRHLRVNSSTKSMLELTGNLAGNHGGRWLSDQHMLVVSDNDYFYALKFVSMQSPMPQDLAVQPIVEDGRYSLDVPVSAGISEIAIGFGFATKAEGESKAVERARECFEKEVSASLAEAKSNIEGYLRRAPAPQKWGFASSDGLALSPEQHRRSYYAAWTFLVQDIVKKLPESDFNYQQLMTGKPSLWNHGEARAPGMAQWDSVLGYQWLAYVAPDAAWSAFRGLMSLVSAEGAISGESLPARKAQTAWILYSLTKDRSQLEEAYPEIRRNLLWEEKNPRWIYEDHNNPDQRDLEFTAAWIYDADFAIKISNEIGNKPDVDMWKKMQTETVAKSRAWFFSDPNAIHQYYFVNAQLTPKTYRTHSPHFSASITQALGVKEFPAEIKDRLTAYFAEGFRPALPGLGFGNLRYPDVNLTAYGLMDAGNQSNALQFIRGVLRASVQAGTFAEAIEIIDNTPKAEGVEESLFSPMNIIEFTWLLNNCRYESGSPTYFHVTE